jgi:hypothetical protein
LKLVFRFQTTLPDLFKIPEFDVVDPKKTTKKGYKNSGVFIVARIEKTAEAPTPVAAAPVPAPAPTKAPQPAAPAPAQSPATPAPTPAPAPARPAVTLTAADNLRITAKATKLEKMDFMGKSGETLLFLLLLLPEVVMCSQMVRLFVEMKKKNRSVLHHWPCELRSQGSPSRCLQE